MGQCKDVELHELPSMQDPRGDSSMPVSPNNMRAVVLGRTTPRATVGGDPRADHARRASKKNRHEKK